MNKEATAMTARKTVQQKKKKGGGKGKAGMKAMLSHAKRASVAQQRIVEAHATKYVPWKQDYISQDEEGSWSGEEGF